MTGLTTQERFWAKVNKDVADGCWLWTGARVRSGYGSFGSKSEPLPSSLPHRIAYTWLVGPIPEGMTLDHLCRARLCVNPSHLEPVTQRVNTQRSTSASAVNAAKTHCPAGHPYDDENTYRYPNGRRQCRECTNERSREWRSRHRDAVNARRQARRKAART